MRLRDFLERFRPAETPGASATGVSADRTAERAAELEPALAQLPDVRQEAAPVRAAADEAAKAVRQDAAQEAAELVAAARERAPEIRRQAADPVLRERRERGARRFGGPRAGQRAHVLFWWFVPWPMRCVWQASRTKAKHHECRLGRRGGARQGLVGRYPGAGGARKVAAGDRLDHALRCLAATSYARYARTVGGLPEAQGAVTATLPSAGGGRADCPGRCPPARSAGRRIRDRQHCLPAARTGRSSRGEPAAVPARGAGDCLAEPAAHRRTSRAPRS
jgi:hypothetical protein